VTLLIPAAGANAANFTVSNLNDTGPGSLREAITQANANTSAPHAIDATGVTGAIPVASAFPTLSRSTTIAGPGANLLTVYRNRSTAAGTPYRIFATSSGTTVTISGLRILNGYDTATSGGGGVSNLGNMTLDGVFVTGNHTTGSGGGIRSIGTLTVQNSTVSGNTAHNLGGGIEQAGGTLTVRNSTVTGNTAGGGTGPSPRGGGIDAAGNTNTIESSTVSGNSAPSGANLFLPAGRTTSIRNTIVSNPLGGGQNCGGTGVWGSQGFNLESASTCAFAQPTDQANTDPALGALADNGGPTRTMAIVPGSPAVDTGSSAGLTTDQRGLARPVDNPFVANAPGGDGADVGAYEVQSTTDPAGGGDPPPEGPPDGPSGPNGDDPPAEVALGGKPKQDLRRKVSFRVTVNENASVATGGTLKVPQGGASTRQAKATYPLRETTVDVAADTATKVKLRLRKKGYAAAKDAGRAKALIDVFVLDRGGNPTTASTKVRLKDR
jgi:hypothetical protein